MSVRGEEPLQWSLGICWGSLSRNPPASLPKFMDAKAPYVTQCCPSGFCQIHFESWSQIGNRSAASFVLVHILFP